MLEDRTDSPLFSDTDPCISNFGIVLCVCVIFYMYTIPLNKASTFQKFWLAKKEKKDYAYGYV